MDVKQKLTSISTSSAEDFQEFRERVDENAEEVFKFLKSKSIFSLARYKVIGSTGTAIPKEDDQQVCLQQDFDLVIFVNHQSPPFDHVLADFEKYFVKHKCKNHEFVCESRTSIPPSVRFRMKDVSFRSNHKPNISFSLQAAANLLSAEDEQLSQATQDEIQATRTLKIISELPDPRSDFSRGFHASFAHSYASFLDHQSPFVDHVIRLAKLWSGQVTRDLSRHGNKRAKQEESNQLCPLSMIVELLAIASAEAEEKSEKENGPNIYLAFTCLLNKFIYFDRLVKEHFNEQEQEALHTHLPYKKYLKKTLSLGGPVLVDPVNPFSNVALHLTGDLKEALKVHAKCTLVVLRNYKRYNGCRYYNLDGFFGFSS